MHRDELLRRLDRAGLVDFQRGKTLLEDRAATGKTPEEILVASGLVSEAALARLIADAYRVPFVVLSDRYVPPEVARLVPRDVAENYGLLAIERDGDILTVAMADPLDLMAEDLVRFMTSLQIRRVMAARTELVQALAAAYDGTPWPRPEEQVPDVARVELHPEGSRETVVPGRATALILEGLQEGATDLHFEPRESGLAVRFRIDGTLQKGVEFGVAGRAAVMEELRRLVDFAPGEGSRPRVGRCVIRTPELEADLSVSSVPSLFGQKVVLRVVDRARQVPDLERSGLLPETFQRIASLLERPSGLLVVAGPMGSGRSALVYGMLHHLEPSGRSLVALEDSWMPDLPGVTCIPVGAEPGTLSMRMALEGALLQDPDVILVRGLEGPESVDLALRAAEEALVLVTLNADGAVGATRLLQQMASSPTRAVSSLLGVVALRRVRRLCQGCRQEVPARPGPERQFVGPGCRECHFTGYRGRVSLQEVLVVSERLRGMLWNRAPEARILEAAVAEGMVPLASDGRLKVAMGLTSLDEVVRALPLEGGGRRPCPGCHRELGEDFRVCPYCDPGLDQECPSCRRPVEEDWRTCPYCHRALRRKALEFETREDLPAVGASSSGEFEGMPGLRTVLVAVHDAAVRAGILEALEKAGYEVLLADDGRDAIEIVAQDAPDLVLAEARLPGVDGLELCRLARESGLSMPILVLHPEPDASLRARVLESGGDGLVSPAAGTAGWIRTLVRALEERSARLAPAFPSQEPG